MKKILLTTLIVICIILALNAGMNALSAWVFKPATGTFSLSELQAWTGLSFPNGTKLTHSYYEGWREREYLAVLEFDAKYTDSFLAKSTKRSGSYREVKISRKDRFGVSDKSAQFVTATKCAWWTPDTVRKFAAVDIRDILTVHLIIDLDGKTKRRVYLYAYDL